MLNVKIPVHEVALPLDGSSAWEQDFLDFHARFADLFARSEPREQSQKYLRALVAPLDRHNGWQMAQAAGDIAPDPMQRLLYKAVWDHDQAQDRLLQYQIEQLGHPDGIAILDETGFLKKGDQSVGVARQYSGTAGKVDNCQVAVLLGYRSPLGYGLLDKRLYLPQSWFDDPARLQQAQVPAGVRFQTKPALAAQMLAHAAQQGLPLRWVTGDEVYGNDPKFRQGVTDRGWGYVLAVSASTLLWTYCPQLDSPVGPAGRRGRPQTRARLVSGQPPRMRADQIIAALPTPAWQRVVVAQGDKGPIESDWAAVAVTESDHRLPRAELWLLARRSVSDPQEVAYYLCQAPPGCSLQSLAQVAASRYTIEQCIEEGKGDTGMDEYEVRHWVSWQRHLTLSLMALAWLGSVRRRAGGAETSEARGLAPLTVPEVRRLLAVTLPLPAYSADLHRAWSLWRRAKRYQARQSHYRRWRRLRRCQARGDPAPVVAQGHSVGLRISAAVVLS